MRHEAEGRNDFLVLTDRSLFARSVHGVLPTTDHAEPIFARVSSNSPAVRGKFSCFVKPRAQKLDSRFRGARCMNLIFALNTDRLDDGDKTELDSAQRGAN